MSRVFRRPMFRKGGNVGEGIMTGIRDNYAVGGSAEEQLAKIAEQYPEQGFDPLTQFLIQGGLNLVSQPSTGGVLSDIATATKDPTQQLFKGMAEKGKLARELALAGRQIDIEQAGRERLKKQELDAQMEMLEREIEGRKDPTEALKFETEFKRYSELGLPANVTERAANFVVKEADDVISQIGTKRYGGILDFNVSDRKEYEANKSRLIDLGKENKIVYDPFENNYKRITMVGGQPQFDEAKSVAELMQIPLPTVKPREEIDRSLPDFGMSIEDPIA